jgi:glutathione S-transferase
MSDLVLTTFDWVPKSPRGYVRDLRIRWALEEAGLPYRVASVSSRDKTADHFTHQPFGQVPWLTDNGMDIFESGAILLHLGAKSPVLMPTDAAGRNAVTEWVFAALNSVEMAALPWTFFHFMKDSFEGPGAQWVQKFLTLRLDLMEQVLAGREWLAGQFSVADILMADVLRPVDRFGGLAGHSGVSAYVARATARPAFRKAYDDQMAHFAAAD